MAIPRSRLVDDSESGLYHCVSRCVRRAFLLETHDDRRRDWIVARLRALCSAFAVDVVAFAVMNNHLHLVLRTLPELPRDWTDREIAHRWLLVRPDEARRAPHGVDPSLPPRPEEIDRILAVPGRAAELRTRLASLSWFMKELKEPIARRANEEDGVTGRFWQDRYRCNRLLDEAAVLCCATYVDLNPVTARMAVDPLQATHTSVAEHLRRAAASDAPGRLDEIDFAPAIEARREPHLPDAALAGPPASEADPSAADARRRRRSAEPVLDMTLGAYLRRLAEVAAHFVAEVIASRPVADFQSVLDGAAVDSAALAGAYRRLRLWGSVVGSTASLAAEAVRRGSRRVVMALQIAGPDPAPG
jgi:REP element-mobilizing transposase RayT